MGGGGGGGGGIFRCCARKFATHKNPNGRVSTMDGLI